MKTLLFFVLSWVLFAACGGKDDTAGCDDPQTWFPDADGDGYGARPEWTPEYNGVEACAAPTGYVANNTDCNDNDPAINPSADEICDEGGVDNDCNGHGDSELYSPSWYLDADGDGYGDPDHWVKSCMEEVDGYVLQIGRAHV